MWSTNLYLVFALVDSSHTNPYTVALNFDDTVTVAVTDFSSTFMNASEAVVEASVLNVTSLPTETPQQGPGAYICASQASFLQNVSGRTSPYQCRLPRINVCAWYEMGDCEP